MVRAFKIIIKNMVTTEKEVLIMIIIIVGGGTIINLCVPAYPVSGHKTDHVKSQHYGLKK